MSDSSFIGSYSLKIQERFFFPKLQQNVIENNELNELKEILIYWEANNNGNNKQTKKQRQVEINNLKSLIDGNILKIVGLINLKIIPFWLIHKFDELSIYTTDEQSGLFLDSLVQISSFNNDNDLFGILTDSNDENLLIIHPSINNKDGKIQFRILKLEFNNEVNKRLATIHKLWKDNKLINNSTTSYFVEIELENKKEDNFLDSYLKKRQASVKVPSLSRQNSFMNSQPIPNPIPLSFNLNNKVTSRQKTEEFYKILEKCIYNEFRMRGLNTKLSDPDRQELYSIIFKSIKFIFRNLNGNKFPNIVKINSVLMSLFDMLLHNTNT